MRAERNSRSSKSSTESSSTSSTPSRGSRRPNKVILTAHNNWVDFSPTSNQVNQLTLATLTRYLLGPKAKQLLAKRNWRNSSACVKKTRLSTSKWTSSSRTSRRRLRHSRTCRPSTKVNSKISDLSLRAAKASNLSDSNWRTRS